MELNELLNAIMPYILSALATVIASVGAYLGLKVKEYLDTKEKKEIVEKTIKYVEQVGKVLGSKEKKELALQKASEWLELKGIKVSDVELDILIESFVNDFYGKSGLFEVVKIKDEQKQTQDIVKETIDKEYVYDEIQEEMIRI